MEDLRIIRTDEEHAWALREIQRLWDVGPGDTDGDRFELLGMLVEDFERKRWPIDPPDPIEAIRFRMEQDMTLGLDH